MNKYFAQYLDVALDPFEDISSTVEEVIEKDLDISCIPLLFIICALVAITAIVIIFDCLNRNKAKNANASEEKEEKDND